jgi:hypothetical protein
VRTTPPLTRSSSPRDPAPRIRQQRQALRAVRIGYGLLLVAAPDRMLGVAGRRHPDSGGRSFARVLGGRQLVEAALVGIDHPARRTAATAVDAIHAICALGFARRWPAHAHALHLNAATATALAVAGERVR